VVESEPPSTSPETPRVSSGLDEGCETLARRDALDGQITKQQASSDADDLGKELIRDNTESGIIGVGISKCRQYWVLLIHAYEDFDLVPASGPRGSPVILVQLVNPEDSITPSPSPTPTIPSHEPGTAPVYESQDDACREASRPSYPGERVSESAAHSDAERLKSQLMDDEDTDVRLVGTTRCAELWVVSVGVRSRDVRVPEQGRNGTPVIAYLQSGFTAQ